MKIDLEIIDNFLNQSEICELNGILSNKLYKYGHSSGYREQINNQFFASYNQEDFFCIYMKEKLETFFNKKYKINRHYMHIQTFGQDGSFHTDDIGDNKYTFCLYITKEIEMDKNGGDFLIKFPNQTYTYAIETNFNRGILFPSQYLHKGLAYNSRSKHTRLCMTWKLEII
jgi:hypothetical protein